MEVVENAEEMQLKASRWRAEGTTIAFVPTMGALHRGHLSLIDTARQQGRIVVVSIFVNPAQFGPSEDFEKYPRTREDDLKACEEHGVDCVFYPEKNTMYPPAYSTYVTEEDVSNSLCGVSRPQFFRGVCTVVARLFNIVQPHVAVFGQKDAQQAAVIKRMVRDLCYPVRIEVGATVREEGGLALSSRNRYLTTRQRTDAESIYKALVKARAMVESGVMNVDRIRAEVVHIISQHRRMRIIYVSVVDPETMKDRREIVQGDTLIAVAAWCDEIRLIDNMIV